MSLNHAQTPRPTQRTPEYAFASLREMSGGVRFEGMDELLDALPSPVLVTSASGVIVATNLALGSLYGRSREALMGVSAENLVTDRVRQGYRDLMQERLRVDPSTAATIRREFVAERNDGSLMSVQIDIGLRQSTDDVLLVHTITDISGQLRTEDTLAAGIDHLRTITDAMPSLLSYIDNEHRYRYNNKKFETWWRVSRQQLYGKPVREVVGERRYAELQDKIEAALNGERQSFESYCEYADGEARHIHITYIPDRASDGRVRGMFAMVLDITERERTAQTLKKWADAFEHCAHGIGMADGPTNALIEINPALARMLGYNRDEARGHPIAAAYVPQDRSRVQAANELADRVGVACFEARMLRTDGTTFDAQVDVQSVRAQSGATLYRIATIQDISERKRAEQTLKLWADAFAHSALGLVLGDPLTMSVRAANPAFARMHGGQEDSLSGTPTIALYAQADRERVRNCVSEADRLGGVRFEAHMLRADGHTYLAQVDIVSVRSADGGPIYRVATFQDITERKQAEEQLRLSQLRLQATMEAGGLGTWIWDIDGDTFWRDDIVKRMFGYRPEDPMRGGLEAFLARIAADDRALVRAAVDTALQPGGHYLVAYRAMRPDGGQRWIEARGRVERDAHGTAIRMIGVCVDIDARKRAEDEIRRLNAELEQRVHERTAQLQSANVELEAFAYTVSHDLKSPLRSIEGYGQLLELECGSELSADAKGFVAHIRTGARHMGVLIDDPLAYSRIDRRRLEPIPLNLMALVDGLTREGGVSVIAGTAQFEALIPQNLSVRIDREALTIALRNMLQNAFKFSASASMPRVTVGAQTGDGVIRLWVQDNGIGFDMKFHDRIFEIFQRLGRSEDYPGTGIGLALVRKAMQRVGGRAWAESSPGHGATFYIEFPTGDPSPESHKPV